MQHEKVEELRDLKKELGEVEMKVLTNFTLADAIREGSIVTTQKVGGWGAGPEACALHAAVISALSRNYSLKPDTEVLEVEF